MKEIADRGLQIANLQKPSSLTPKETLPNVLAPIPAIVSVYPQPGIRNPQAIELHIEELIIHGFAPDNDGRFVAAVESELTRLLGEGGISQSLSESPEIELIHGGAFRVRKEAKSEAVGEQLAKAIYSGVAGGKLG